MLVRDRILKESESFFGAASNADEAVERLRPELGRIERAAEQVLKENGFDYSAEARIVYEFFDTREYDGITLPAGNYTALKISLGAGTGKNWWCVMFPPLCLPAAKKNTDEGVFAVFNENGAGIIDAKDGYKVKFKVVEIVEHLIEKLK